jgi:hypothetical protein
MCHLQSNNWRKSLQCHASCLLLKFCILLNGILVECFILSSFFSNFDAWNKESTIFMFFSSFGISNYWNKKLFWLVAISFISNFNQDNSSKFSTCLSSTIVNINQTRIYFVPIRDQRTWKTRDSKHMKVYDKCQVFFSIIF